MHQTIIYNILKLGLNIMGSNNNNQQKKSIKLYFVVVVQQTKHTKQNINLMPCTL